MHCLLLFQFLSDSSAAAAEDAPQRRGFPARHPRRRERERCGRRRRELRPGCGSRPAGCCSPSAPRCPTSSCGAANTVPRARPPPSPRWAASRGPGRLAGPASPARRRRRPRPRPSRRRGPRAARDGPQRATGGATHLSAGAPARPCAEVATQPLRPPGLRLPDGALRGNFSLSGLLFASALWKV